MTTITAHATHGTGFFRRFGDAVSDFFAAIAEARRMADRYDHLRHLSNTELAERGISREDIPQVVAREF